MFSTIFRTLDKKHCVACNAVCFFIFTTLPIIFRIIILVIIVWFGYNIVRISLYEISELCKKTEEPVFLTKNGEGDLVVMDIETYNRREKMLQLREALLSVEEDRIAGKAGCSLDDLEHYLDSILSEA